MPNSLTDAEKRKRGTFDKRFAQGARDKKRMDNVLAFPVLKKIPKPEFPLREKGATTFTFWCEKLLDAGLLTSVTVGEIENLALIDDLITGRVEAGKPPSIRSIEVRRQHLIKLEGLDVDTTIYAGVKSQSAFSQCGFPNRLRSLAAHQAYGAGRE